MVRLAGSALCLMMIAACNSDTSTPLIDAAPERTPLCTATLSISGTFTPSAAVDPTAGCQPAGTWALTVTTADKGTCTTVKLAGSYTFTTTGTGRSTSTVNNSPASGESDVLTITGDNDKCTGNFDLVLPDGTQFDELQLQPQTPTFASGPADASPRTLTGTGEYDLWAQQP